MIVLTMFQQDLLEKCNEGSRPPHHNNIIRYDILYPIILPKYVFIEYTTYTVQYTPYTNTRKFQ